ncbi:MAG: PepSY-like domain-containing protein [Bacteroidota bacterium]
MKKLIFGLLIASIGGLFFACQKESLTGTELIDQIANSTEKVEVRTSETPESITTYVEENFYPLTIDKTFRVRGKGWEVQLTDDQDLYFNERNGCLGDGEMRGGDGERHRFRCMRGDDFDIASLPAAISEYVTANYPDATIASAIVKGDNRAYGVELSDGTVLLFNGEGEFVKVCDQQPGGGGHGGHGGGHHDGGRCIRGDVVEVSELPQAATDYVAATYPNETIQTVVKKGDRGYGVELSDGTVLLFDIEGVFIKECGTGGGFGHGNHDGGTPVAVEDLPGAITDYVATNYPDATIEKAVVRADGNYFLRLSNHVKLVFDSEGNLLFDSGN